MSVGKEGHPSFQRHLARYHAWDTAVVQEGIRVMVEKGEAPPEVIADVTGVAFHKWRHATPDGRGGSPLHAHPFNKPRS